MVLYLLGISLTRVSVIQSTEIRHLSANGSKTEPSMEDCPLNFRAINPSTYVQEETNGYQWEHAHICSNGYLLSHVEAADLNDWGERSEPPLVMMTFHPICKHINLYICPNIVVYFSDDLEHAHSPHNALHSVVVYIVYSYSLKL